MLGKTHMAVGIALTLAVTRPQSLPEIILASGAGAFGALVPDIDIRPSKLYKDAGRIAVSAIPLLLLVILTDFITRSGVTSRILSASNIKGIVTGLLLFTGICVLGKRQPHRSFTHSFLALALLSLSVWMVCKELVLYFATGFLSHILADLFNKKKVQVLYPLSGGVCFDMFSAGGMANDIFFAAGCIISVAEIISLSLFA